MSFLSVKKKKKSLTRNGIMYFNLIEYFLMLSTGSSVKLQLLLFFFSINNLICLNIPHSLAADFRN